MARPVSPNSAPLRVGLLVDSNYASKHVHDFTRWAQSKPELLNVVLITLNAVERAANEEPSFGFFFRALGHLNFEACFHRLWQLASKLMFWIIISFERMMLSRAPHYSGYLERFDISTVIDRRLNLVLEGTGPHADRIIGSEQLDELKKLNPDLLINFGRSALPAEILKSAALGTIAVLEGDDSANRSGPAGFWEVYSRQDTSGFTIRRLAAGSDAGAVLMRGRFQTQYYYSLNLAALWEKSFQNLKLMIERIASTRELPPALPSYPYAGRGNLMPSAFQSLVYMMRLCWVILFNVTSRLLDLERIWTVAYTRTNWREAVFWNAKKIKNPEGHFLADPFVVSRNGKDFCFVEDFDYQTGRANIAVYELTSTEIVRLGTALDEPFHLSFPYLFEYRNELFMCPETSENKDVRVYKCVEFPLKWKLEKVILTNISAVDPILLERNGKWWLFVNLDRAGIGDYSFDLSIYSSDSPLGDRWVPHPLNPIYVDASLARNGGLVRDGDKLFRISQGQGFNLYGKKSWINEITTLNDTDYAERAVVDINPGFGNRVLGTHHLYSNGSMTVFDIATWSRVKKRGLKHRQTNVES